MFVDLSGDQLRCEPVVLRAGCGSMIDYYELGKQILLPFFAEAAVVLRGCLAVLVLIDVC